MLKLIAEKRFFFAENANEPFLDVYLDCLNTYHIPVSVTQKKHQLNAREWYNITAHYTNKLTRAICQDLEAGKLDLLPYQLTRREKYLQQLAQIKEFKQRLKDG